MQEIFLDARGELVSEAAWHAFVDDIDTSLLDESKERIVAELARLLERAVLARVPRDERVGVLFSGGVDSTLIAQILKRAGADPVCITVGFQDGNAKTPEDIIESKRAAQLLGVRHEIVLLDLDAMDKIFRETCAILGTELTNVVNAGVGAVEVAGFARGKELGVRYFMGGLGSEELFAGYDRHEKALAAGGPGALHRECLAGLRGMYARDLRRDCAIARSLGVAAATPLLDEALVRFALRVPPQLKITSATFAGKARGDIDDERSVKKMILREAALVLGLPAELAMRPKRAAQYGSRTNNALTVLAKRNGFERKDRYLQFLSGSA